MFRSPQSHKFIVDLLNRPYEHTTFLRLEILFFFVNKNDVEKVKLEHKTFSCFLNNWWRTNCMFQYSTSTGGRFK